MILCASLVVRGLQPVPSCPADPAGLGSRDLQGVQGDLREGHISIIYMYMYIYVFTYIIYERFITKKCSDEPVHF